MTTLIPLDKTAKIEGASGAVAHPLQPYLLARLSSLIATAGDGEDATSAAIAYIEALGPKDPIEEVLAAQMLAVSETAMTCFSRAAAAGDKLGVRDVELRHGEKLFNLFSRLLEGFEKRRNRLKIERILPGLPGLTQTPRR